MHKIHGPSCLYVFSDGVYDITKADGSIWGFTEFLEFMAQPSISGQSDLDRLFTYTKEINQMDAFDDDFTILEIVLE